MIIQKASYSQTRKLGFTTESNGKLTIFPKPSATSIYGPVTHYTTRVLTDEKVDEELKYSVNGMRIISEQDGYDCLIICNGMWGFYTQTGIDERNSYTRYIDYKPPKYWVSPLPWARSLREKRLKAIEICNTNGVIEKTYAGKLNIDDQFASNVKLQNTLTIGATNVYLSHIKNILGNEKRQEQPELTLVDSSKNTPTYVGNIYKLVRWNYMGIDELSLGRAVIPQFFGSFALDENGDKDVKKTRDIELAYIFRHMLYSRRYTEVNVKEDISYVDNDHVDKGNTRSRVILDSKLVTKSTEKNFIVNAKTYTCILGYLSTLIDWPIVTYEISTKKPVYEHNFAQPCNFVPLMMHFKPSVVGKGPIDDKTGRRCCDGRMVIALITSSNIAEYYDSDDKFGFTMTQVARPITKNPVYTLEKLSDILNTN